MTLADEFEILFNEQRRAVALATIPLFDRMEPDTKLLFTAPFKKEEKSSTLSRKRTSNNMQQKEQLTYSHYSHQMRDPNKLN